MILPERDEAYYTKSIHLSLVREALGGVKAKDSYMFNEALAGLHLLGVDIVAAVEHEIAKIKGKAS
jgi:hypothetical protein